MGREVLGIKQVLLATLTLHTGAHPSDPASPCARWSTATRAAIGCCRCWCWSRRRR